QHHCRDGYAGPRQQRRRHPGNDLLLGELHYLLLFSTPPGGGEVHFPNRVAPSSLRALLTCGGTSTYTTTTRPIATVEARRTIRLLTLRSDRAIGDERFGTALATVDSRLLGCTWETGCSPHTRFVLPSRVRPGPRRDAANLPSESRPERGRCGKGRPRGRECFRHENYDSITSHVRRDWAGSTATAGTVGLLEQRVVSRTGERIRSPVLREFSL